MQLPWVNMLAHFVAFNISLIFWPWNCVERTYRHPMINHCMFWLWTQKESSFFFFLIFIWIRLKIKFDMQYCCIHWISKIKLNEASILKMKHNCSCCDFFSKTFVNEIPADVWCNGYFVDSDVWLNLFNCIAAFPAVLGRETLDSLSYFRTRQCDLIIFTLTFLAICCTHVILHVNGETSSTKNWRRTLALDNNTWHMQQIVVALPNLSERYWNK